MRNNKSGFSLVELMVVVAIIGILATIAIPNFSKFQNKAKQSNAKAELSAIFTAEKAYFAEYSSYYHNLHTIGFIPDGINIVYTTGTPGTCAAPAAGLVKARLYTTGFGTAFTGSYTPPASSCNTAAIWNGFYPSGTGVTYTSFPVGANTVAGGTGTLGSGGTFTAVAAGILSGTNADAWTMDENSVLTNSQSGI